MVIDVATMRREIARRPGQPTLLQPSQMTVVLDELARLYAGEAMRAGERRVDVMIEGICTRVG